MSHSTRWTADDVPELSGRTVLITGGNGGIGFEAARLMTGRGARVVLACRSTEKATAARARILEQAPRAEIEVLTLDLASLTSVREAARRFLDEHEKLDVLVNNAGVMALPFRRTADGFEMQLGTNHLGHFALTGLLLEALLATPGSRVVTISSGAHAFGRMDFDHLDAESTYQRWRAYGQSKLANLLFMYELQRRLEGAGADCISVAAHPGAASTQLPMAGPQMEHRRLITLTTRIVTPLITQSALMGALPTVYAATVAGVRGGDYYGPTHFFATRGYPEKVGSTRRARDPESAARLWRVSSELTGVHFALPEPAPPPTT